MKTDRVFCPSAANELNRGILPLALEAKLIGDGYVFAKRCFYTEKGIQKYFLNVSKKPLQQVIVGFIDHTEPVLRIT